MSETGKPTEWAHALLDVLRQYSRPVRIGVLCVVTPPLILAAHYVYNWPCCWPTQTLWFNIILAVAGSAVLWLLILVNPEDRLSLDKLPDAKPVIEESLKYFKLGKKLPKEKKALIKQFENTKIREAKIAGKSMLSPEEMLKCASSEWELDRIVLYLVERYQTRPTLSQRMRGVQHEEQLLGRTSWKGTLGPLHYAIESICGALFDEKQPASLSNPELRSIKEVLEKLNNWNARCARFFKMEVRGDGIIRNCEEIDKWCTRRLADQPARSPTKRSTTRAPRRPKH